MIHPTVKIGKGTRVMETAIIEENVVIGENCFVGHFVMIRPNCTIGHNTQLLPYVFLEGENRVGNNVSITPHSHITKGMIIEDDVFIGPHLNSMNDRNMVYRRTHARAFKLEAPIIRRAARIGGGVQILPRVEIGENAMIGAGSVVVNNVPARSITFGAPARVMGHVDPREII